LEKELITKTGAEINECIENQVKACKENGFPHFAPSNGRCWKCNKNIYQNYGRKQGATGLTPITGCPHCNRSYCD